ncbi:MAG: hypothetical protein ACNA8W_19410 [Bradymonadaceae bacterium]
MVKLPSKRRYLWMILAAVAVTLILSACTTTPRVPAAQPMPPGGNFSGLWYSPHFEHMYLLQSGDTVRGVYAYREGGRLEGTVEGNLLKFEWTDPGSREHARRGMSGHGYLQLTRDGESMRLVGQWGHDEKYTGAGPWEADFVRELESDDPMTVEDVSRVH